MLNMLPKFELAPILIYFMMFRILASFDDALLEN